VCPRKLTGKCRQLFRGSEPCFDNEVSAFDKAEPGKLWKRRGTYSLERAGRSATGSPGDTLSHQRTRMQLRGSLSDR